MISQIDINILVDHLIHNSFNLLLRQNPITPSWISFFIILIILIDVGFLDKFVRGHECQGLLLEILEVIIFVLLVVDKLIFLPEGFEIVG